MGLSFIKIDRVDAWDISYRSIRTQRLPVLTDPPTFISILVPTDILIVQPNLSVSHRTNGMSNKQCSIGKTLTISRTYGTIRTPETMG